MNTDTDPTLPPPMFDLVDLPPWEDPVARHNLAPLTADVNTYYCAAIRYGRAGHGWVNHVCTGRPDHDNDHRCGNCDETWTAA